MSDSSIWLPKGEQGDPGPQGPVGPAGPPGPPGPDVDEAIQQLKDELASTVGAGSIGTATGDTVQDALDGKLDSPSGVASEGQIIKIVSSTPTWVDNIQTTGCPRDLLVWEGASAVSVHGNSWPMGGFRTFGKYQKVHAKSFPTAQTRNAIAFPANLAHGMTSTTLENWYAVFACANDGDAVASFKIAPFLYVKSVSGSVCTLGKCGEVTNVNEIADATYTWPVNSLAGTDVLVVSETFGSGNPSWTMRKAKITANTTTSVTLDAIGNIGPKCMLLPAPAGFEHYRYCATFYIDTAEVRNFFDGGGGPVRTRMAGTNVVFAHGNNGTNSTYLDGVIASGTKRIDLGRFIPPLATGVYLQSTFLLGTSTAPLRAEMRFDMDGSIHTPEVQVFQKDSAQQNSIPLTVFLTFRGSQSYMPSTGGDATTLARTNHTVTGWFEP